MTDTGIFAEPAPKLSAGNLRAVLHEHWAIDDAELTPPLVREERHVTLFLDRLHRAVKAVAR
ncbi:MAG TPA: hypothetical protein VGD48_15180 [Kutzneria sp.]